MGILSKSSGLIISELGSGVYSIYWGVLFGTLLTWVFAVAAAADDGWMSINGVNSLSLRGDFTCSLSVLGDDWESACSIFNGAKACQHTATIFISAILVLVVAAAFQPAPATGKFGIGAGISLAVFSVLQLIAFSLMASFIKNWEQIVYGDYGDYGDFFGNAIEVKPGPTFCVAVVAFIFGVVGAIVTLVFVKRATADQDGPLRGCIAGANATGATAATAAPPAVGTV